jgi:multimeric flavodoxin WrbA
VKTLVLFSSPNRKGNTGILLDNFLKGCQGDVEIINVFGLKVKPCNDCRFCGLNKRCVNSDDMDELYEKVENCDAVVIASPLYFTSFPAPLKTVIDRFQVYWSRKYIHKDSTPFKRKKGILVMTSGLKGIPAFSHCEAMMKQFFSLVNAEAAQPLYADGTDKDPVKDDADILNIATERGREFCG